MSSKSPRTSATSLLGPAWLPARAPLPEHASAGARNMLTMVCVCRNCAPGTGHAKCLHGPNHHKPQPLESARKAFSHVRWEQRRSCHDEWAQRKHSRYALPDKVMSRPPWSSQYGDWLLLAKGRLAIPCREAGKADELEDLVRIPRGPPSWLPDARASENENSNDDDNNTHCNHPLQASGWHKTTSWGSCLRIPRAPPSWLPDARAAENRNCNDDDDNNTHCNHPLRRAGTIVLGIVAVSTSRGRRCPRSA